jgi:hypothetical protein
MNNSKIVPILLISFAVVTCITVIYFTNMLRNQTTTLHNIAVNINKPIIIINGKQYYDYILNSTIIPNEPQFFGFNQPVIITLPPNEFTKRFKPDHVYTTHPKVVHVNNTNIILKYKLYYQQNHTLYTTYVTITAKFANNSSLKLQNLLAPKKSTQTRNKDDILIIYLIQQ